LNRKRKSGEEFLSRMMLDAENGQHSNDICRERNDEDGLDIYAHIPSFGSSHHDFLL